MDIENNSESGIFLSVISDELLIKGNEEDLKELIDYIDRIINSESKNDHIHLDELSLISSNSKIKNLIIEKGETNER